MPYKNLNPPELGYQHTDTSHDATPSPSKAATLRALVFEALKTMAMTADETARFLNRDRLSIRPRLTELKNAAKIIDTGERRRNESGKLAAVFRAARPKRAPTLFDWLQQREKLR